MKRRMSNFDIIVDIGLKGLKYRSRDSTRSSVRPQDNLVHGPQQGRKWRGVKCCYQCQKDHTEK